MAKVVAARHDLAREPEWGTQSERFRSRGQDTLHQSYVKLEFLTIKVIIRPCYSTYLNVFFDRLHNAVQSSYVLKNTNINVVISINSSPRAVKDNPRTRVSVIKGARRGVRVLREIRYLRKTVSLLIPRLPFCRVVREIMVTCFPNTEVERIQASALEALQEAAEAYLVQFFEDCVIMSMHANRVTIKVQDLRLVRYFRGRTDVANK
ncbi:histone H3-like centromeric protein A [Ceratina calcarata]|uniref:Histone H3-like centromeric protein A n=1 Tax=Ceratina calcarata TaxID=156304 RepID=A0AAJ7JB91_9HYME|nr:histone H3-like centromeric protein A [Ceratina calcarata]